VIDNAIDADISPDGRRLAFIRSRVAGSRYSTLCVASSDGHRGQGNQLVANEELSSPRWSPDGERIVVTSNPHSTSAGALLLVNADGGIAARHHATDSGTALLRRGLDDDSRGLYSRSSRRGDDGHAARAAAPRACCCMTVVGDVPADRLERARTADRSICCGRPRRLSRFHAPEPAGNRARQCDQHGERHALAHARHAIVARPSYAPDGNRVVFTSERSGNPTSGRFVPATARCGLTDDAAVELGSGRFSRRASALELEPRRPLRGLERERRRGRGAQ